ncbi:MAG TPA: dTDP-4-dehydrorhamnose 3,5-epimerase [Burkholderiaceae bacterium]|nr:dTDP-4-dehydrorhamnose 3,5-epimerase [Burkholderiaceae bacterium]
MAYRVRATAIAEVLILEPQVHRDARGLFYESFNQSDFERATGCALSFVQDNHSRSVRNVLRGLHYQLPRPQGKLVRVVCGEVYDVVVDLRRRATTFGQWAATRLSAENFQQLWVPPGFAHGFLTLSDVAEVIYKVTDAYAPEFERCLLWSDPALGIAWPLEDQPRLSAKDAQGERLADALTYEAGF